MYWTCASGLGPVAGGVREEVAAVGWSWGWRTGRGVCACGVRSCTGWAAGKDAPRTRLVTRPLPPTGVTLTGPGEEDEDRYPPPALIGSC